jgi:hypothetical protein
MKLNRIGWLMIVARMEEKRFEHRVLVENPNVKNPFGKRGRLREDNINIDAKETI